MISPETRAKIIEALKENSNATAVARQIPKLFPDQVPKLFPDQVAKIAKEEGIELIAGKAASANSRRLPVEKREEIIRALEVHPHASAVAKQVGGVSIKAVAQLAKRAGIKLAFRISAEKREEIIKALEANPNASAVARQVGGVTQSTVRNIAVAASIPLTAGRAAQGRHKSPQVRQIAKPSP